MSSFYVITQYIIYDCLFYFNPRSREGSDALTLTAFTCPKISIRVPTRGATGMALHHCVGNTISIRAPTRGATMLHGRDFKSIFISIRAPTRGATHISPYKGCCHIYFNPRSHEGSDATMAYSRTAEIISIRAPTRGATFGVKVCAKDGINFNPRSHEGSDHAFPRLV